MERGTVWGTWGLALTCPGALVSLVSCTSLGFTFLSEGGEGWVRWSPVPEKWVVGGCGARGGRQACSLAGRRLQLYLVGTRETGRFLIKEAGGQIRATVWPLIAV